MLDAVVATCELAPMANMFSKGAVSPAGRFARMCSSRVYPLVVIAILGAANMAPNGSCSTSADVTGNGEKSGQTKDPTEQAETIVAISPKNGQLYNSPVNVIVAFNDRKNPSPYVTYVAGDNIYFPGVSFMGWSYSTDNGASFTYGGAVPVPAGWTALWGDPGVAAGSIYPGGPSGPSVDGVAYLSNMAVPNGIVNPAGFKSADSNLQGVCVARSLDFGVHFAIDQCMRARVPSDTVDGTSIVLAPTGRVCVATHDTTTNNIAMWCKSGVYDSYVQVPDAPFAAVSDHPRIRADSLGNIFVIATEKLVSNFYEPTLAIWNGTYWIGPYPLIATDPNAQDSTAFDIYLPEDLRTGDGFSFDVGNDGPGLATVIRMAYTTLNASDRTFHIHVTECPIGYPSGGPTLLGCSEIPGWRPDQGVVGQQFLPVVKAAPEIDFPTGGVYQAAEWKLGYESTNPSNPNAISVRQGNLTKLPNGTPIFGSVEIAPSHPICPETYGYWGDYNDMQVLGPSSSTDPSPQFIGTGTNSDGGCTKQWAGLAVSMHVTAMVFK